MNMRRTDGDTWIAATEPAPARQSGGLRIFPRLSPQLSPTRSHRLQIIMLAAVLSGGASTAYAQEAFRTESGTQVPVLPSDRGTFPQPSLQPGLPGAPSFTRPPPDRSVAQPNVKGERPISGPTLPNAIDAGLADAGLSEPGTPGGAQGPRTEPGAKPGSAGQSKPKPAPKLAAPAGADLAYGAYQRGYYASAAREAEARLKTTPGDAAAAALLGVLYEQGLGVHLDLSRAARWYKQADVAGSAPATFALAMMTLQGRGVDKDEAEGKRLLVKAAEAGDAQASYNLALVRLAEGVPASDRAALGLLQAAAQAELPEAQYLLASLYRKGRGTVADDIRATQLLRRAADNRLLAAEVEYAIALFNGNGVHKDEPAAARLFLKAALDGNAVAQNRMARLLTVGRGVDRNLVEAAGWHMLASGRGLDDPWLDDALKGLSPADRSKAEAFAAKHREPLIGASQ